MTKYLCFTLSQSEHFAQKNCLRRIIDSLLAYYGALHYLNNASILTEKSKDEIVFQSIYLSVFFRFLKFIQVEKHRR